MSLIEINNLSFSYDKGTDILSNFNLTVKEGESVAIVGANGVGKSTLLRLLVGLETGYDGSIRIAEKEVIKKNLPEIRKETGYVFQDAEAQLFMPSVYDDVAFAPRNYNYCEEEVSAKVEDTLKKIGIYHLKDKATYKLSGGEKKLVSIATILSTEPKIVLMDEPSIALDPKNRRNLIHVLNGLSQCKIIATHDLDMALDTCDRTIILKDGKTAKDGKTKELLCDSELLEECGLELPLSLSR